MAKITLPAGQSVRDVADRLGMPVEKLQKQAGVEDAEAPLPADRFVDLPDGFLRPRPGASKRQKAAIPTQGGQMGGMNAFLALDIEQKRSRAVGGLKGQVADEEELAALDEARRALYRFEADSNELAIDLFDQLGATGNIGIRAQAFAGQGRANAYRHLLFGEPPNGVRAAALSSAKAALMANPKLADAHLAMALALRIDATADDLAEAQRELERGIQIDPKAHWCWAELAGHFLRAGAEDDAIEAADVAREIDPDCVFALEVAAAVAWRRGETERAEEMWTQAGRVVPTYANAQLQMALALKHAGRGADARDAFAVAFKRAQRPAHRDALVAQFEGEDA